MRYFKILFLAADPRDTTKLQTDEERRRVEAEILKSLNRDAIRLIYEPAVRPQFLIEVFRRHRPQVVHFSGHGSPENEVVLETDDGSSRLVGADVLEELFRLQGEGVRVVLLNACYSQTQAAGLLRHVPCAIGMNRAIPDRTAVDFAAAFYQGLASGESVRRAFDSSLLQLRFLGPFGGSSDSRHLLLRDLGAAGDVEKTLIPELLERDQGVAEGIVLLAPPWKRATGCGRSRTRCGRADRGDQNPGTESRSGLSLRRRPRDCPEPQDAPKSGRGGIGSCDNAGRAKSSTGRG
jgi:CHAT domain